MTFRTTLAAAASVLALTSAPLFAACEDGEILIKFAHVTNTDKHPKGIAAQLFADRVNEEMNGVACVEVFPNSTLYDDDKVLEAMLLGDVQMAAPSLSKFETFTKKFRLYDLPFVFRDINVVDAYQMSDDGQALLDSMQRKGLQGLAYWHSGMKQMSANTPLLVPADAEGLKFRIQASDVLQAQFEAIGANPQKMAFSEVYGALQTGVVDGQENTWSNTYGQKYFEVQDGITNTDHGVLDYLVVVGAEWWDGLPDDVRDQLATIMMEVTVERNAAVTEVEEASKQAIIATGAEVRELTPEQRALWVEAMQPVWAQFAGDIGQDVIDNAVSYNELTN
ncbi:DctP family TRAP transporter solute-binding subunit [Pseudoruegeria sp. SK021]|uniref:DctP family TRAP transporter solute-binding subunit n=1 Tax=Pseudoruegeria sp. SK021 TaxID=1933035 RepID=UPI000A2584BC|nr:DctP family TRAP transporter solute-binding subunit [Pseudoruegeria sp. SK021]OSP55962.1 C4-dicarboxylate ABC transporter [Pseudoruegeria sp. SK021]